MSDRTNVLILGGGGREHAIATALSRSKVVGDIHAAPGNPGMKGVSLHAASPTDAEAILELCRKNDIGLVISGPEAPLVAGIGDALRREGVAFFGPGSAGAALEGSKIFAKEFMSRHGVPTASFDVCRSVDECVAAIAKRKPPFVIKADGLAAGKGVFLPDDRAEAERICRDLIEGHSLGDAGAKIVVEDFTEGRELTLFAITDGERYVTLEPSRDHKRAFDGDKGPNTGGMGAFAPVSVPDGSVERAIREVLEPTLAGLRAEGIEYRGVLYMGLMITPDGSPSVVEYNVRFGDPEAQAVLPLYAGDLGEAMLAAAHGRLAAGKVGSSRCSLGVVIASDGYPGEFKKGFKIDGLDADIPDTYVFHSGTKLDGGDIVTNGGRVLTAVGVGATFAEARERAYARVRSIKFEGMRYRNDIGWSEER